MGRRTFKYLQDTSASGKGTSAELLTSVHIEKGGDGGVCSFCRGEFLGQIFTLGELAGNTHRGGTPDCSAHEHLKKQNAIKWSSVQHTQNSLFQKHFPRDFCAFRFLVPRILPRPAGDCWVFWELYLLPRVWPSPCNTRIQGYSQSVGSLIGVGVWGCWGGEIILLILPTAVYWVTLTTLLSFNCGKNGSLKWHLELSSFKAQGQVSWPRSC